MLKTLSPAACVVLLFAALPAQAARYTADNTTGSITFAGTHAGTAFAGSFETFTATIDFDPADVAATQVTATIDLASATTGNAMFDGTLPSADWFNVKATPTATFAATQVEQHADGRYAMTGDLTLRGITKPVTFTFALDTNDAPVINAGATLTIDRLAYDIGKASDAKAEWVSQDITLTLKLAAQRQ